MKTPQKTLLRGSQINPDDISSSEVQPRSSVYTYLTAHCDKTSPNTKFWNIDFILQIFSSSLHTQKEDRNELKDYDKAPFKVDGLQLVLDILNQDFETMRGSVRLLGSPTLYIMRSWGKACVRFTGKLQSKPQVIQYRGNACWSFLDLQKFYRTRVISAHHFYYAGAESLTQKKSFNMSRK